MSWWHALVERVDAALRPNARDRELDDEIAHHIAVETSRLVDAGLAPAEASRRALERFGNPSVVAESTRAIRGGRWQNGQEGTMQDLRYAVRSLTQHYGFTLVALLTLAVGIGVTSAAFAVLDTVLLRPLPYRDADRLVFLQEVTSKRALNAPSHPNFADWRARAKSFDGLASAMFPATATVRPSASAEPLRVTTMGVSRGFFNTLGVTPAQGREFSDAENALGGAPVAMVAYEFWQSEMGGRLPLGTIAVGDSPRAVVGVLPPGFTFITPASVFLPHEQGPGTCRTCRNYQVIGRLKPGVPLATARAEMSALAAAMATEYGADTVAADVDVQDLQTYLVGDYRTLLVVIFGAAAVVLLVACTNLLSAQLARAWIREREMLVRVALGASRGRLLRQLLIESAVLVGAGAILGLGLAALLARIVSVAGAGQLPRLNEIAVDGRLAMFAAAAAAVTVLLVGIYPAVRLSRAGAGGALRGTRGTSAPLQTAAWRALLGLEIALAVALSIGSMLLVRTVRNIMNADTGFSARGLITAAITPSERDAVHLDDARADLASLPAVTGVAYTTRLPLSWGANAGPVRRRTDPPGPTWPAMAGFRMVSPGYFTVLQQPVLQGRGFVDADRAGAQPVAIITTGIARALWPGHNPVGKVISTNYLFDEWLTVVGVVAEASSWTMPKGAQNEIYVPYGQHLQALPGQGQIVAVVRGLGSADALAAPVRASLHRTLPDSPALIRTMDERIARTAADRRFAMLALTAFAMAALLLAGIGIYGVVWYVVTTRSREIGVRMALGATPGLVRRGVLGGAFVMALAGSLAGCLAALGGSRVLEAILFGVSKNDPYTYLASVGVMMLAVLAGAWIPARRASRVDPLTAMRAE